MLRFLHWCYSLTALLSANQNRVIFSCILLFNNIHEKITRFWLAEGSAVREQHHCKKCNTSTSAKSATPVQITNKIFESDLQSTGVRLECYKNFFVNFPFDSKILIGFPNFSEHFRTLQNFPNILKCCVGRSFWELSDIFRRFPKTSDNFRRFKIFQKCWKVILKALSDKFPKFSEDDGRSSWAPWDIFRFFPKTSEDLRRFSSILETCRNDCFRTLRCFFLSFPKNFQTFNKGETNPYFRLMIDR